MAKKEKKVKEPKVKKQKRQKKQAPLVPEHQRPLICPPDQAGRGLRTRILGYVCRCLVVMCLCWALMMFFGGAFTGSYGFWVGVSEFTMLGLALFATAVFGLICYNRYTALGGLALGAAGIAILSPNVVQGVLALYNGFLCRLYLSKFTVYLTTIGVGVPNLTSGESLAAYYVEKLTAYGADVLTYLGISGTESAADAADLQIVFRRARPLCTQCLHTAERCLDVLREGHVVHAADAAAEGGGNNEPVGHGLAGRGRHDAGKAARKDSDVHINPPVLPE